MSISLNFTMAKVGHHSKYIMLAVAKGEETLRLENKVPPNNGEAVSNVMISREKPIKLRITVSNQVRMARLLLLSKNRHAQCQIPLSQ